MESYINFTETHASSDLSANEKWKLLIVDDEEDIHKITRLVLKPLSFGGRTLEFFHAYSAEDAFSILKAEPDIAIVLLDVVMETEDAGLVLVERIREELKNKKIRIILRTGQPGQAPEKSIISKYDINDYKEKTELTTTKLFTSIISSLRSYQDLLALEGQKKVIEEKSFLNQYILNTIPCKSILVDKDGTAIFCNNTDNGNRDEDWVCVKQNGKCTEKCNWLMMGLPLYSEEKQRWEYKTNKKTYEVCFFPENNDIRLIYAFDITDRVRIEQEKASFEKQLIQSQKMEAVGLLASGIVHDFNNYLTAISGFAQIIRTGKDDDTNIHYSDRIVKSVDKACRLISRLLVFSRKGKDKMIPFKIKPLLTDSIELLKPKCKLVKIYLEELIEDIYVYGDANLLQNTFINLGINAIDAMPEGGKLNYTIKPYKDNGIDDYYISIEISDTGTGINQDIIERIFEPFFTTKEEGKGTGLGLAGAYGCIKKHNGLITVQSSEGEGTNFRILLPKLKHSDINSPLNLPSSLPERKENCKISFYSADNVTRELVTTLIENLGHEVILQYPQNCDITDLENLTSQKSEYLIIDADDVQGVEDYLINNVEKLKNVKSLLILSNNKNIQEYLNEKDSIVVLRKTFEYDQFYNSFAKVLDIGSKKSEVGL